MMKKHTAISVVIVALTLSAFPLASYGKGKPGGGGSEPPAPPPNPEIAAVNIERNKPRQLILMNADGSNATTLYSAPQIGGVDLSPTANELVFTDRHVDESGALIGALWLLRYTVDATGIHPDPGGPDLLDATPQYDWIYATDISPDGQHVLYWRFRGDSTEICLRSTDPTINDVRTIYVPEPGRMPNGLVWLSASSEHKVAILTQFPEGSDVSEIIIATVDPSAPDGGVIDAEDVIKVLSTANRGFTIPANIDSARTTESLLVTAISQSEFIKQGPRLVPVARPALWHIGSESVSDWVTVSQQITVTNSLLTALSPDDTKMLVSDNENVVVLDVATGAAAQVSSVGSAADWKP
jgi:hypothetical protein